MALFIEEAELNQPPESGCKPANFLEKVKQKSAQNFFTNFRFPKGEPKLIIQVVKYGSNYITNYSYVYTGRNIMCKEVVYEQRHRD